MTIVKASASFAVFRRKLSVLKTVICALTLALSLGLPQTQTAQAGKTLDIYFIDVEGGQSTLIVTPAGKTMLVDAGFPGVGGFSARPGDPAKARDPQRILAAAKAAGVSRIDYLLVTHFHADHVGRGSASSQSACHAAGILARRAVAQWRSCRGVGKAFAGNFRRPRSALARYSRSGTCRSWSIC